MKTLLVDVVQGFESRNLGMIGICEWEPSRLTGYYTVRDILCETECANQPVEFFGLDLSS